MTDIPDHPMEPAFDELEDDDEIPEDLRDRWARRDHQYARDRNSGTKLGPLSPGEIAAIRAGREDEAEQIEDHVLMREARMWEPPR